jgi:cell division protein YceG involved in septum cleavage
MMKSIVNRIVVVLVVGALTSVAALAKVQKHKVTFENDTKVNGTLVKKGTYDLKFDDQTGQLSIVKNGKTVAQAMTRLEPREKKAGDFQLRSSGSGDESQLIGVTFGGSDKNVVIANNGASTSGSN